MFGDRELGGSFGTEAVIDAGGDEVEAEARAEEREDVQERGGVRAAGAGAEDAITAREEALVADQALGEPEERGRMRAA